VQTRNCPNSTPRNHLLGSPAVHVGLIEYDVRSHMCWPGSQHLFLAVDQIARVEGRQLKAMPMRDRVRGASLHAVPTKNTPVVIDVVDLRIALGATYPILRRVVSRFDINAVGRAIRRAQEARDTFLKPVFVALQYVCPAIPSLNARPAQRPLPVRIIFNRRRLEHLGKGNAHALGDGRDIS
jgi:hypothetical protein